MKIGIALAMCIGLAVAYLSMVAHSWSDKPTEPSGRVPASAQSQTHAQAQAAATASPR